MYFLYILECKDGSLYTGITTDLKRRLREHEEKMGARYTRARGVKKLLYSETLPTRSAALKREVAIKRLERSMKLSLIKESCKGKIKA